MKQSIVFITLLFIIGTSSCKKDHLCIDGSGNVTTENIYAPDFNGVKVKGSMEVRIQEGETQSVVAIGHPNIIDKLQLDVVNGILKIDLENDCYGDYELAIQITTPTIEKIMLSGSGGIDVWSMANDSDLRVDLSGSGSITLNEMTGVQNLEVLIDGSGTIRGHQDFPDLINLTVEIDGSGDFKGFDIVTDNCSIDISGSGDCRVHVEENLEVDIHGSGNVHYIGYPTIDLEISGSGNLIDAN